MAAGNQTDGMKLRPYAAWLLFGMAVGLTMAAWLVWIELTGTSFWKSPNAGIAVRLRHELLYVAITLGALAPMFWKVSIPKRLGLCAVGGLTVGLTYFLFGLVWLAAYGV